MSILPTKLKLEIFVNELAALDGAGIEIIEDDFAAIEVPYAGQLDVRDFDIAQDPADAYQKRAKAWRAKSEKAYRKSDTGKATKKAYRESYTGKATKRRELDVRKEKTLDAYLNRQFVAIDSEGRAPLHTIDKEGRTPLEAWKETGIVSKYLTRDSSGNYWERHEVSLIGAASIDRPFGTPIEKGVWQSPVWISDETKGLKTDQCFDCLLSLPEQFAAKENPSPIFVMFSASYDWSMWCKDIPFPKKYEIVRQRGFAPPCKRMQGYVFYKKYAIQIRPHMHFKLGELRWPDDPYGKAHKDDPEYQKGVKGARKVQFIRKITIVDTFRFSPQSFVETIRPLMKRGLIPKHVFDTVEREKQKRGGFHLETMDNIKLYTSYELHSLCVFMHMMRDAYWTAKELRLQSFHSPASAASALLKQIGVREHSWPVKSTDLDHEQEIPHAAYFGKGSSKKPAFQYDLASAYPYAMQSLPSMKDGHWEKLDGTDRVTFKQIERSCILSIFRIRFCFYAEAPFYPLPYRLPNSVILYPRIGVGYYMRDDILAALAWCKKFKVPATKALIIEEANFFHPAENAICPFTPIADAYMQRIEFDKKDPKGPEQLALKLMIASCYEKLAERKFRGIDPATGEPIIPPHASPWYASAITAHTRREVMLAALHAPELIIQFATDAVYSEIPLALPRLTSEADIKAGKEDKLLGDWCWAKVPAAVFIQSGLAFYLDEAGKVVEAKSRGLPLKKPKNAQEFLNKVLAAWNAPYDPEAIASFKAKKIARHASTEIKAFVPMSSAIVSPDKDKLHCCKWGEVSKTVWLDDAGAKRDVDERDLKFLTQEAVSTFPKESPNPEAFSALRFPDWVEDATREEKRQEAAINQFHRLEETELGAASKEYIYDTEDAEFHPQTEIDSE